MKKLILLICLLVAMAEWSRADAENYVYKGEIGPYKIHMVLNENLQGYYYYDKNPKSHFKLVLAHENDCDGEEMGLYDGCAEITLQEYAPNTGKNTGTFDGVFGSKYHYGFLTTNYTGVFTRKSDGKRFHFEVGRSEKIE